MKNTATISNGHPSLPYGKLVSLHGHSLAGKIAAYIRLHAFDNPGLLQVSRLSRHFGACNRTLRTVFKHRYGISLHGYVMQVRHKRICELLLDSTRTIKDIAYSAQYTELSNFSRDFAKMEGISPSDYRKKQTLNIHNSIAMTGHLQESS